MRIEKKTQGITFLFHSFPPVRYYEFPWIMYRKVISFPCCTKRKSNSCRTLKYVMSKSIWRKYNVQEDELWKDFIWYLKMFQSYKNYFFDKISGIPKRVFFCTGETNNYLVIFWYFVIIFAILDSVIRVSWISQLLLERRTKNNS